MSAPAARALLPASPEVLLAERLAVFGTAYRRDEAPEVATPSVYRLARLVLRGGYVELYRTRG